MAKSQKERADYLRTHRLHDPEAISRRAAAAAKRLGLRRRILARTEDGVLELFESPRSLEARAARGGSRPRVYLSAGLHGDEPGGVEALLRWMEEGKAAWFSKFDFTIAPCLNPGAIRANTRLGTDRLDWNRGFAWTVKHEEIDALKQGVRARGPFDMALLLHEDYDGCGLYLYELDLSGEPSWGCRILAAAQPFLPPDLRPTIEGVRAKGGVISRSLSNPALRARLARYGVPEAAWLSASRLARRVYTLEAPSEYDASSRADGLRGAVEQALSLLLKESEKEL